MGEARVAVGERLLQDARRSIGTAPTGGHPFYYFAYGAAAAEVAIDTLTGEMRVVRADMLHDCGRSLNPAIDIGQVEGGFIQGMGWLTTEELWWDAEGPAAHARALDLQDPGRSRRAADLQRRGSLDDAPNREPTIFRSKAVGEPPLMLAISVLLAIRDAMASLADHRLARSSMRRRRRARACAIDDMRSRMQN